MSNNSEATHAHFYDGTRRRLHSLTWFRGPRRHRANPVFAPALGESSEKGKLTGKEKGPLHAPVSTCNVIKNSDPSAVSEGASRDGYSGPSSKPPFSLDPSKDRKELRHIKFLMDFGDLVGRVWNYLQIAGEVVGRKLPRSVVAVSTRLKEEARDASGARPCTETIEIAAQYLQHRGIDIDFELAKLAIDVYADRNLRFHSGVGALEQSGDLAGRNRFLDNIKSNLLDYLIGEQIDKAPQWQRILEIYKLGRPTRAKLSGNTTHGVPTSSVQPPLALPDPKSTGATHPSRSTDRLTTNPASGSSSKKRSPSPESSSSDGRSAKRARVASNGPGAVEPPALSSDVDSSMADYIKILGDLRRIDLAKYQQFMRKSTRIASRTLRYVQEEQSGRTS